MFLRGEDEDARLVIALVAVDLGAEEVASLPILNLKQSKVWSLSESPK